MTVAVIQPYFIPYAGYFRLFAAADLVVAFDCVQFPRRGWVHRNRLPAASGDDDWLTLPLVKVPQSARIRDLRFPADARERLTAAIRRFPILERGLRAHHPLVDSLLAIESDDVSCYLIRLMLDVARRLGLGREIIRSSSLSIPEDLRAQDRVIAIARAVGATAYVNPSGGRALYDRRTFAENGLELGFLTPYGHSMASVIARMLEGSADELRAEIERATVVSA